MNTATKITKIVKTTASAAVGTACSCAGYVAAAAPIAVTVTAISNKITSGAFDVKGAAITVAKNAAVAIGTMTAISAATAAFNATNAAMHNCGEFADTEEPSVEDFDDWDDEEEEEA